MPRPRLSIITAVFDPPEDAFEDAVTSVLGQTSQDWEWILADDCSTAPWVAPRLARLAQEHPRVRVHTRERNGGIVAASNDALALAEGEFVSLLDHDDVLAPDAVESVLAAIDAAPEPGEVDYVYSDQDFMTPEGRCHRPFHKPEWSPERFRHHMYTTHFSTLRRSLVAEVGGFRAGFDGSQDHDLVLRVTERARSILHVPKVLYHWRQVPGSASADPEAKPYAWDAGVRAVQEHLDRVGIAAVASRGAAPGFYRVEREPDLSTSVSIIIPTMGSEAVIWGSTRCLVVDAVRSVLASSAHPSVEVVVVHDLVTPPEVLEELRAIPGIDPRCVAFTEPFNFAAKANVGAVHARGEILLFLNDDVEAVSEGVVENLIAPLREPDVGITGAKLLYEDGRIQHGGIIYGDGRITHHYHRSSSERGRMGELVINREVTGVTGACLAIRRSTFDEIGGFTERLPGNYNDVDLCLKVLALGQRILWLHEVVLHHFESVTREASIKPFETKFMARRWGSHEWVTDRYLSKF